MVSGNTKKMCCSCEEVAEESPPFNPGSDESGPVNPYYRSTVSALGDTGSGKTMGGVWVWVAVAAIVVAIAALVFYAYNQKKFREF